MGECILVRPPLVRESAGVIGLVGDSRVKLHKNNIQSSGTISLAMWDFTPFDINLY